MTIRLNWDDIYRDYLRSGLSQSAFYNFRFPDYFDSGQVPSRSTFFRYIRRCSLKPFRPAVAEISRSPKVLGDNMQIVELDESSLQCVADKTTFSPKSSGVRLLRVRLPNGGIAEFETCSPERSVAMILQAIRGSAP